MPSRRMCSGCIEREHRSSPARYTELLLLLFALLGSIGLLQDARLYGHAEKMSHVHSCPNVERLRSDLLICLPERL